MDEGVACGERTVLRVLDETRADLRRQRREDRDRLDRLAVHRPSVRPARWPLAVMVVAAHATASMAAPPLVCRVSLGPRHVVFEATNRGTVRLLSSRPSR